MLRFTKKVDYGVLIMIYLTQHRGEASSAREIANYYEIPRPVVANLLKVLARSGMLSSQRGNRGGYDMTRDPVDVTLAEVAEVISGRFALTDCAMRSRNGQSGACERSGACPAERTMNKVHDRILRILKSVTIADLARDAAAQPSGTDRESERASDHPQVPSSPTDSR